MKDHLNHTYAPWFAKGGLIAVTFDYRGWGGSEPKLVPISPPSAPDANGAVTVRAIPITQVVEPFDQVRDITSCLDYLEGEPQVDRDRIGLWGSSYGGGHVSFIAAHDSRVKVIVAQVGAQQPGPALAELGRSRAIARARGKIGALPPPEDGVAGLAGVPDLARMRIYRPIDSADKIRVPTLVIDAEQEELFDRMQNGHALYEIVSKNAPARYVTFRCKHYAIYDQYYQPASTLARDWFVEHLVGR